MYGTKACLWRCIIITTFKESLDDWLKYHSEWANKQISNTCAYLVKMEDGKPAIRIGHNPKKSIWIFSKAKVKAIIEAFANEKVQALLTEVDKRHKKAVNPSSKAQKPNSKWLD